MTSKAGLRPLLLATLVAMVAACPSDPRHRDPRPVAVAGPVEVEQAELLAALAWRGVARATEPSQRLAVAQQVLEQLIDEKLMLAAAARTGIEVKDEDVERELRSRTEGYPPGMFLRVLGAEQLTLDAFRDGVRRRMTQDAFLRARLSALPPISDADVEAAFAKDWSTKKRPAQIRARQVLLRTGEEATHVVEEIRARKLTVEQAAIRFSQGLEASEGGDLGWFAPGDLPKVFDVCFVLEPGVVSDPVPSEYGHHIFQVIERREERVEPLAAVRDQIYQQLVAEQQALAGEKLFAELRAEHPIQVSKGTLEAVVALLPEAPATPIETEAQGSGRSLDSHAQGADPIPPLKRE